MKSLAVLGSTGSVGTQTLCVLSRNPGKYNIQLLAAKSNWRLMEEQIRLFRPATAILSDASAAAELLARVGDLPVKVLSGREALLEVLAMRRFDLVVAAMVGHGGLLPVIEAINAGSDIALANKEALVMAGHLITEICREKGVRLLPLDSEHSAIFQCLEGHVSQEVRRLYLTASGGPFRTMSRAELEKVTPSQAVQHPNWQMGAKISVDSATLMNKGLEVIEARWLFGMNPDMIEVLIHPQSIIHSMVEYCDGSVLAQLGVPSMELPIQYALSWPKRWPGAAAHFVDWLKLSPLSFQEPNLENFPCLELARTALQRGGNAPAVMSSANDICVEAFLSGNLHFCQIPEVIKSVLEGVPWQANPGLNNILESMNLAIAQARNLIMRTE